MMSSGLAIWRFRAWQDRGHGPQQGTAMDEPVP